MNKKTVKDEGPSLFDDLDEQPIAVTLDRRALFVEQVLRDLAVLREDVIYHAPSTEFFKSRVTSMREVLAELDESSS